MNIMFYAIRIDLSADRDYGANELAIIATLHQASTQTYDIDAYANAVTKNITKIKNIILFFSTFFVRNLRMLVDSALL